MNERSARAYLSRLTEPADQKIGELIAAVGPLQALRALWQMDDTVELGARTGPRMLREIDEDSLDDWLTEMQHRYQVAYLIPGDEDYPTGLADLGTGAPAGLWVRGQASTLGQLDRGPSVAIVGARACTSYGEHVAMELANDLVAAGIPVVSGAAYGIDAAAHRAVLAAGGITVAFLAGGADRAYPAGNSDLIHRVAQSGAVVSEVPPGSSPTKWRFLARNRLIAAATTITVVVEAGFRSGSLNTAGHATALHRPLGAVPGPITSVTSAGCHRLLRDYGATCITSSADVLELLALQPVPTTPAAAAELVYPLVHGDA